MVIWKKIVEEICVGRIRTQEEADIRIPEIAVFPY
jgi:hypothetical protein